jgi:hypothetical protein
MVEADREAIERAAIPFEYEIENVSQRVVRLIQGTAGEISHRWDGIIKLQGQ